MVVKSSQRSTLRPIDDEGYPQCWYALILSEELGPNQIVGKDLCDGRVIIYRDSAGKAHVMSRYCKHLGADLSLGEVVGDDVRCAFHHWQYGPDGACSKIATGDKIPERARLISFPTEEKWGLIWAFWGAEPLYDLPSFHSSVDLDQFIWKAYEIPLKEKLQTEPWIFGANAFDFQHLKALHGLADVDPGTIAWNQYDIQYGSGAIIFYGMGASSSHGEGIWIGLDWDTAYLSAGAPMGRDGMKIFMVEAASKGDGSEKDLKKAESMLDHMHNYHTDVIDQDVDILNTLNLDEPGLLVESDWGIARYLKYVKDYPRISMAELVGMAERGA